MNEIVSGAGRCYCQGESGPRGGGHGPWCTDCGQHGRGEPVVGRSSCDAKVWEVDDQREVVDVRLWRGEEVRRLWRRSCEREVLRNGRSLTKGQISN